MVYMEAQQLPFKVDVCVCWGVDRPLRPHPLQLLFI